MTMSAFAIEPEALKQTLQTVLGDRVRALLIALGEVTLEVGADDYRQVMQTLRDAPGCRFEQLIDLCGVDYSQYGDVEREGPRFAAVVHLLSVSLNQRVRVQCVELLSQVAAITNLEQKRISTG